MDTNRFAANPLRRDKQLQVVGLPWAIAGKSTRNFQPVTCGLQRSSATSETWSEENSRTPPLLSREGDNSFTSPAKNHYTTANDVDYSHSCD
jgi:hypothetical protein